MRRPCLVCGELGPASYCERHARADRAAYRRATPDTRRRPGRGYDHEWTKLSRRARAAQPFCSDCGSTENLQADHTVQAWRRKRAGLAIRLSDVDVVCGDCNVKRGDARNVDRRAADDARAAELRRAARVGSSPRARPPRPRTP